MVKLDVHFSFHINLPAGLKNGVVNIQSSTFTFKDTQGNEVFVYKWMPDTAPKAIVQISHGMVETAARYERVATALTAEGYGVYANDQLGHGKTAKTFEDVGHLEPGGFHWMLMAVHQLTGIIKQENPGLDVYLVAHSMGSFIAQRYVQEYSGEIKGLVLSGTAGKMAALALLKVISGFQKLLFGTRARANFLHNMQFGGFNKKFAPNRTEADWLSRDNAEVDKYIADPYCGVVATVGFDYELACGLEGLHDTAAINKIRKDLPIYLYSGAKDPVGEDTKSVLSLIEQYRQAGIKDLEYKFYPDARHETLNEINRDEVTADLIDWLKRH